MNSQEIPKSEVASNTELHNAKSYIKRYFSEDLKEDKINKSIIAKMEKKQIKKWLLNWAETP